MAEPEQQPAAEPKRKSGLAQRIKNYGTTFLRAIGFGRAVKATTGEELQYIRYEGQGLLDVQPVQRLKEKNLLNILKNRSTRVSVVEHEWDVFSSSEVKDDQGQVVGQGYRDLVEETYQKAMIYLDPSSNEFEYRLYQNGGSDVAGVPNEMRRIEIMGEFYDYPVPGKVRIRYPVAGMKWDWIVNVCPFGYAKSDSWANNLYIPLIEKICRDVRIKSSAGKGRQDAEAIENYISIVEGAFKSEILHVLTRYATEIEEKHYKFVKSAEQTSSNINGFYGLFAPKHLMRPENRKNFLYFNTYRIMKPVVYGKGKDCAKIEKILIDRKEIEANTASVQRSRRKGIEIVPWTVKEGELGPGLDPYGHPLEVDEDNVVMIDKHPEAEGERRSVPQPDFFVSPLDALEMVNYMNNMFDTYRDDLRDGRYHPNSLTINEYLQANNESIWGLWGLRNENSIKKQSNQKVKLNSATGEGSEVEIKVKATDKNPAFDLSLFQGEEIPADPPWRHAGRKYYYDVPDGTMKSKMMDAHISARGVSMYVMEKVTREMQKFDEDTLPILNQIGMDAQGLDYGTRPWSLWGKHMIPNVYGWREMIDDVNKTPTPKKTSAGYYEQYERIKPKTPD